MKLISDKGLENYTPGDYNGTIEAIKKRHPSLKLYSSVTRKSDGQKFKAGQWVKVKGGQKHKIIAFDYYNHPLGRGERKLMRRAIFYWMTNEYIFHDIEEYKDFKEYGK